MMDFLSFCEQNKVRFHENQRQAVMCDDNCTVSAGAGSGKTMVLSYRFLRLVMEGKANCDEILTITFTKKATAEMRSRIYQLMAKAGMTDQMERFSKAQISTVDGFCKSILTHTCSRYGFPTDFGIEDQNDYKLALGDLADKVMDSVSAEPMMENLLGKLTVEQLRKMLVEVASDHWNFISVFDPEKMLGIVGSKVEQAGNGPLLANAKDMLDKYEDAISPSSRLNENVSILRKFIADNEPLGKWPEMPVINGKLGNNADKAAVKDIVPELKAAFEALHFATAIDMDWLGDAYSLLGRYLDAVKEMKLQRNKLTFTDIMQMTLDSLTKDKNLRDGYKNRFRYIMIDEFQDNNDEYRKLLYLLSERPDSHADGIPGVQDLRSDKIFLVGDEKQSIYRFRGADVTVFKTIAKDILSCGGKALELTVNFRSEPELIDGFNILFSTIMENKEKAIYEADYRKLDTRDSNGVQSRIVFHYGVEPSEKTPGMANANQSEAAGIAQLIQRMVGTDDFLIPDGKGLRRPGYGDIVILLKRTTVQGAYEKALLLEGIPYTVGEARSLISEALYNDFLCVLTHILFPTYGISQVALLKSPLCNMTDLGVSLVMQDKKEELSAEDAKRYAQLEDDLSELRKVAQGGSICAMLRHIWYTMGYRSFMVCNPANQVYSEHFDYLYSLAAQYDADPQKNLCDFVFYLRSLFGDNDNDQKFADVNVFNEVKDAVSIMTVHASKGLEFPIVILAEMQSGGTGHSDNLSVTERDGVIYLPCVENGGSWVNPDYVVQQRKERLFETAESRRILYVAATRAESHIVFSGTFSKRGHSNVTLMDMFTTASGFDFESKKTPIDAPFKFETMAFDFIDEEATKSSVRFDPKVQKKMEAWYAKAQPDGFEWTSGRTAVTDADEDSQSDGRWLPKLECDPLVKANGLQTGFGTYVHAVLENSALKSDEPADESFMACLDDAGKACVRDCALNLRDAFLESDIGRQVMGGGYELYPERAFVMADGASLVDGVVDLLCVGSDEVLVIDFKTDSRMAPQTHEHQLATYGRAVSKAYPGKRVKCLLVYLREPGSVVEIGFAE